MAAITINESTNIDLAQNPIFMATGNTTTGNQSSVDGITWAARTLPSAIAWTGLSYGLGLSVAIGTGTAGCATSADGTTWTARTLPSAAVWYAITFSGTRFVTVANGSTAAAWSDDGFTWTAATMSISGNWKSIAYGNGVFVAINNVSGTNFLKTCISTDGITWNNFTASITSSGTWTSIVYGNGKFVAICSGGTVAAESIDGINWAATTLPSSKLWNNVCYGISGFVAVPSDAANNVAAFSSDGTIWEIITLPASVQWIAVSYGYGKYIAVSVSTTSAATSFDGKDWLIRTQVSAAYITCGFFPYTFNSGDTLTINNNSLVTINTDQKKFWNTITINNGTLAIENNSTTDAITFSMGRLTGAGANTITPSSGLGKITVNGNWINIGIGDESVNQTVTAPYTDYIAALWIETGLNTGVYKMWLNATGSYGDSTPVFNNGLLAVSTGNRGNFFKQNSNSDTFDKPIILTSASGLINTRIINVTSTSNIIPGCSIIGTGVAATAVVQKIISSTKLEVNLVNTGTVSGSLTCYNPYRSQLTNSITFGDGINGNLIPTGANIKIPNILITDLTPGNIQTISGILGAKIVLSNGGSLQANICLFDESYSDLTQGNSVSLEYVGFSIPFIISECYQFSVNNLAFPLIPVRRYFSTFWNARDLRTGNLVPWSYISNANIQNLSMVNYSGNGYIATAANTTTPGALITFSQTDLATFNNCNFFSLNSVKANGSIGISGVLGVTNCTFSNINFYGCHPINFQISSGNILTNISHSSDMFNGVKNLPTSNPFRIYNNPSTGLALDDNTTYFLKVRSFRTWNDTSQYFEGKLASFTTLNGDKMLNVPKISAISSAANTVRLDWERKSPEATIAIYEIYRSITPNFIRTGAARITNIVAAATITYNDTTATNGNTYYYGFRKHSFQYATITNSAGTSGLTTITSSLNMRTSLGNTGNAASGKLGSTKIYFAASYIATTVLAVGMQLNHANITPGTTIISINEVNEVTLSTPLIGDIDRGLLTIGIGVGMAVFGTNVAIGATVVSIAPDGLSIEVNNPNTGTVSGTLTFTNFEDSNEITVISQGVTKTCTNVLLQSNTLATTWVATTITPLAAQTTGVHDTILGTTATLSSSKLTLTSTTGNITQSPATAIGSNYTFGVWLRTDVTATQPSVSGTISLGTTNTNFTVTGKWQYFSANFTAIATTTATKITVNGVSSNYIFVSGAFVSLVASSTVQNGMPIATTTAAVSLNPAAQEISFAYSYSRSISLFTNNQGVEVTLAAAPAGTLWSELYLGTTSDFTPSQTNLVGSTLPCTGTLFNFNNGSNNNKITGFTLEGNGGITGGNAAINLTAASSNNKFLNFSINAAVWYLGQIATINTLSNNNLFHNFVLTGLRSNSGLDLFATSNNCSGQIIQNIIINRASDLSSNIQSLNTELKNVTSGSNGPLTTTTSYSLGGSDGVTVTGATIYDYMFLELNFSSNKGALFLRFNASSKISKPYTITGNATFDNTGKLFFNSVGDNIEITWPHKILGVSGFQNKTLKAIGTDLGLSTDRLEALFKEYSINSGSGFSVYKEMTPENLSAETVSATNGFYIKIKLTALFAFKYSAITNAYIIGETIKGIISNATATVIAVYLTTSTTGTVILDNITNGPFVPGESIVRNSDLQTRTNSVAVISGALQQFNYPFLTSNIYGLQIPTIIDETVLYPSSVNTLTLTGIISGSDIVVLNAGTTIERINVDNNSGSTYQYIYENPGNVDIGIFKSGYVPFYIRNYLLTTIDASLPIAQVIDRNYN